MKRGLLIFYFAIAHATLHSTSSNAQITTEKMGQRGQRGQMLQVEQKEQREMTIESVQISATKQGGNIELAPISSTILNQQLIEQNQVEAIKDLQAMVPNLFIPEYGSRITSSIYVRGLGARIDNPVVGLNIDNVPYLNKNAFDNDVADITRMEVLRGPQSTLYGRNTMGGVINIETLSPMHYQGIRLSAGYASGNTYNAKAAIYHKFNHQVALAAAAHYSSTDGLFENTYTAELCDTERDAGARIRLQYAPSGRTFIDNTLSASLLKQGGYPYMALNGEYAGAVNYNDPSSYDRFMVNNGLSLRHNFGRTTLTSVTAYQHLDDSMTLDQDFSPESIFTLTQATKEHTLSEDIVWKSNTSRRYSFLLGGFAFAKIQDMRAPVTFKEEGIQKLILDNANKYAGEYEHRWDEDSFVLNSDFNNITLGAALYHESSYTTNKWEIKGGVRLDYEYTKLRYNSYTTTSYSTYKDDLLAWNKPIDISLVDDPWLNFFEVLPKVSVNYKINSQNRLYATVAKGYKAGGFNTQMFSDILQQELMTFFSLSSLYSPEELISYKPEYSWNYEIGAHLSTNDRRLRADVALFFIDVRDQQLTKFPDGMVTGRMMTNAGRSRSFGAELSAVAKICENFLLSGAYGYTNAKFTEYNDNKTDYAGNYVPYAPQQTLSASATYTLNIGRPWLRNIDLEVNTNGAGKIYWDEANSVEQPLYALLGSAIRLSNERYTLALWGRNLTNKSYNTFYFESMGNQFVQQGRPMTLGATINITL